MNRRASTAVGFVAVLLWSMLAILTVGTGAIPPFQLTAMAFSISGTLGILWVAYSGRLDELTRVPLHIFGFGTCGLFGYHFLYFSALRTAPPEQASLIAYLWPLLIVLFSGLLPGERLTRGHAAGALISFTGAALVVSGDGTGFGTAFLPGYLLAFGGAIVWSSYSLLSRRLGATTTDSVAVFCVLTAILSALAHVFLEQTVWPGTVIAWLSILALGVGPVGFAFFAWDVGVKKGDIQVLGTLSYAAPVLSTMLLILAGITSPSWQLLTAAALIATGAGLATRASANLKTKR